MSSEQASPIAQEMSQVDTTIAERLQSDVVLVNQLSAYIINSGGKRLRPQLVLLSALVGDYREAHHVTAAATIEFIHTATLLHDDVVDDSKLRRGRDTANEVWGNEAAVLVGDFLYSRAFEMLVEIGEMRVMEIMARTTNQIAEGEVMQLLNVNNADITVDEYRQVIQAKTAILFEAAMRIGAVLSRQSRENEDALAAYGSHLGTAFQLVDDALDYSGNSAALGKNVGDDLAEGKPTLPLISAMQMANDADRQTLRDAIEQGGRDKIEEVMRIIAETDSLNLTLKMANDEAQRAKAALKPLPQSTYKDYLIDIAEQAAARTA
ncbi:MAG: polyprenyl synthetase family protein [Granulosicoccaceae bacterium]